MRGISQFMTEEFASESIFESMGSEKITNIFKNKYGKVSGEFRPIEKEMQWDKITDADVEEMSTEEARKLAYKRNSDVYILWIDGGGTFLGRSFGNYNLYVAWNFRRSNYETVRSISLASDKALVIRDPDKFTTRELRAERAEAKKGALALMDAAQVAKDNMKRYKAILDERRFSDINFGDVVEQVRKVTENYSKLIGDITDDMVSSTNYRETIKSLEDIEGSYHKIMDVFKNILDRYKSYNDWKKYQNDEMIDWARKNAIEQVNVLQKLIDTFNSKHIESKEK